MQDKRIIALISLAFLAAVTLADSHAKTFKEKWAEWGKNPNINRFGKFVDVDTGCNGKPCNFPEEIVPYDDEERFCVSDTGPEYIFSDLPDMDDIHDFCDLTPEIDLDRFEYGTLNKNQLHWMTYYVIKHRAKFELARALFKDQRRRKSYTMAVALQLFSKNPNLHPFRQD
ncbi:hypothetical protein BG015_005414 [Linnemannia schmuckeri]|uniref:Uncharacterized protein n=1 Tax=Linnemannia schmuckeri TaxID=64567 RepID=A0A9P5UX08_9FUNG|nr:hypothetical protein BG015_005414 [Linnemannia schmuckeri]